MKVALIVLGLIMAAVPNSKTLNYRMSPDEMLSDLNGRSQYIGPDEIADMLIQKDPSLQLIDLRSAEEYQKFHLPGGFKRLSL